MARSERCSALVLAAGAGERLGGCAKPLILLDGRPLIARLIDALTQVGVDEVVVVLGHHAPRIAEALAQPALAARVTRVVRVEPPGDQVLSLQRGLAALDSRSTAAMICLADQPWVDEGALRELIAAYTQRPVATDMVLPWVDGMPGNPVMMTRALIDELRACEPPIGGQAWRRRNPERVHRWVSGNRAYVTDLDTPEDIDALRRAGSPLSLP